MESKYKKRITHLQRVIESQNIDALLITSQDSIYYLSGASYTPVERPFFIIIKPRGVPDLVVPELEREHMEKVEGFGTVKSYFEYPSVPGSNWYDKVAEIVGEEAVLGIEPSLESDKRELLRAKETKVIKAINEMRMVKDEEELAAIRLAAKWTDLGMKMLFEGLYEGQSVLEASMYAKKLQTGVIKTTDYNYMTSSFLTAGWPAPKSSQPHSLPDLAMPMGKGPIVLMSYNRVNGYAAECERTVFLGEPSQRDKELFGYMMEARRIAFSMLKPGVRCSDIDAATQKYFTSLGLKGNIIHRTGHGIGIGNHEAPWLSVGGDDVLQENMVISIEPAIYFSDIGGFRHSDTVLITKDGYEVITDFPTDLKSVITKGGGLLKKLKGSMVKKAVNLNR